MSDAHVQEADIAPSLAPYGALEAGMAAPFTITTRLLALSTLPLASRLRAVPTSTMSGVDGCGVSPTRSLGMRPAEGLAGLCPSTLASSVVWAPSGTSAQMMWTNTITVRYAMLAAPQCVRGALHHRWPACRVEQAKWEGCSAQTEARTGAGLGPDRTGSSTSCFSPILQLYLHIFLLQDIKHEKF